MSEMTCADCGSEIELPVSPSGCPTCGSKHINILVWDESGLTSRESIRTKQWEGEKKGRADKETRSGDDLYRDTGEWNKLYREIDRKNDRYVEHIEDQEGNVKKHDEGLLSKHRGHGSAKHKRKSSTDDT